jgi:hypothetical protein
MAAASTVRMMGAPGRAGGLHSRAIEVLDQRGIADRFISQGQVAQVAGFAWISLDISDLPTRHNYGLALWQNHIERILAGWVGELRVPIYRGREVTGFAQDDTGVDVKLSGLGGSRVPEGTGCRGSIFDLVDNRAIALTQVAFGAATVLLVGCLLSWNVVLRSDVRDLQEGPSIQDPMDGGGWHWHSP